MHRSRPTCHFGTGCQSPVISRELFPCLIRLADLSLQHWELDAFVHRATVTALSSLSPCRSTSCISCRSRRETDSCILGLGNSQYDRHLYAQTG